MEEDTENEERDYDSSIDIDIEGLDEDAIQRCRPFHIFNKVVLLLCSGAANTKMVRQFR